MATWGRHFPNQGDRLSAAFIGRLYSFERVQAGEGSARKRRGLSGGAAVCSFCRGDNRRHWALGCIAPERRLGARACRLRCTPFLCVQRIVHAAVNISAPCSHMSCFYRVVSLLDNRRIKASIRYWMVRSGASPRRKASWLVGRSFTGRTGRGRLLPRRPRCGAAFPRPSIRRHFPMRIGPMVVRR